VAPHDPGRSQPGHRHSRDRREQRPEYIFNLRARPRIRSVPVALHWGRLRYRARRLRAVQRRAVHNDQARDGRHSERPQQGFRPFNARALAIVAAAPGQRPAHARQMDHHIRLAQQPGPLGLAQIGPHESHARHRGMTHACIQAGHGFDMGVGEQAPRQQTPQPSHDAGNQHAHGVPLRQHSGQDTPLARENALRSWPAARVSSPVRARKTRCGRPLRSR